MGMFASVTVHNSITLPHFPEEVDRDNISWQSKRGIDKYGGPYRITEDGRLEEQQRTFREKTPEEKQQEAETWGFDSWDEYIACYEEHDGVLPPDKLKDLDTDERAPIATPREQTLDEEWWSDCNKHGSFEFHTIIKEDPTGYEELAAPTEEGDPIQQPADYKLNVFLQYEARFTKGELDEIIFQGERGFTDGDDGPVESAKQKIDDWREWRESP